MPIQQAIHGADMWAKIAALVPPERLNTPISPALAAAPVDTPAPVAASDSYRPSYIEEAPHMAAAESHQGLTPETIAYIANSQREASQYVVDTHMSSHYTRANVVAGQIQRYQYINGNMNNPMYNQGYQDQSMSGYANQGGYYQDNYNYGQGYGQGNFANGNVPLDRFGQPINGNFPVDRFGHPISPAMGGYDPLTGQYNSNNGFYDQNRGIYDSNTRFGQNWNIYR